MLCRYRGLGPQLCTQVSLRVSLYPGNTLQEVCRSGPNPGRHAAAGLFSHMLGFYIKKPESMADRPGLFTPPCFIRVLHLHIFVFHIANALILINIFWCNKCEISPGYVKSFSQSTLDQTRMHSFCLQSLHCIRYTHRVLGLLLRYPNRSRLTGGRYSICLCLYLTNKKRDRVRHKRSTSDFHRSKQTSILDQFSPQLRKCMNEHLKIFGIPLDEHAFRFRRNEFMNQENSDVSLSFFCLDERPRDSMKQLISKFPQFRVYRAPEDGIGKVLYTFIDHGPRFEIC